MEKSGSPHIFHIPTILAGRNKTKTLLPLSKYQSQSSYPPSIVCVCVCSCACMCVYICMYTICVCRPLLQPVESLLQALLLWDPASRGGGLDPNTNKPYCYTALHNMLTMKVTSINLTCVHTHITHSTLLN